ncbi:MAG: hypothetical protein AAF491_10365 [Verrucomicrobiota bacterium]
MTRNIIIFLLLSCSAAADQEATSPNPFVSPGREIPTDLPVWGHRDGIRVGLAPTPGPHGLIRIYAPYLGQSFPRMVNFISIEPTVMGKEGRSQSELEASRHRSRERGLSFYASEDPVSHSETDSLPSGLASPDGEMLRVYIHTEPFANGAMPVIEMIFHSDQPYAVEFRTHAHPDSAPLAECVLSATMGNYGLLRQLQLGEKIITAEQLWPHPSTPLDPLGFLPWKTFSPEQFLRISGNKTLAKASSNEEDPARMKYPDSVPKSWRYHGSPAVHAWSTRGLATVAVNARLTFWETSSEIPGGPSIENFELRAPFNPGQSFFFSVNPLLKKP